MTKLMQLPMKQSQFKTAIEAFLYPFNIAYRRSITERKQWERMSYFLDLSEAKEAINNWIDSCRTEHQVDLCDSAIDALIIERYSNKAHDEDLLSVLGELGKAICDKRMDLRIGCLGERF